MVEAIAPYDDIDKAKYPLNMSVCGQVLITNHQSPMSSISMTVISSSRSTAMSASVRLRWMWMN
ncbi:MAG: hypothetical protein J6Y00_05690 [Paludibacteraceae bacterium]|nr:hypothetical protein [Paludibacteraceae bacterium]